MPGVAEGQTSMKQRKPTFEITGRHVLFAMIAFFGVVIAANVIFVRVAVTTFPGEKVEKSYYQGLNYNDVLAEKQRQSRSGWHMQLKDGPEAGARPFIEVKILGPAGDPVHGAHVQGEVVRPMTERGRQSLSFFPVGDGVYRASMAPIERGAWDLSVDAAEAEGGDLRLSARTRIVVE